MEEGVKMKGYSIWSLLLIMTLLAVWMAVPRKLSSGQWSAFVLDFFFLLHQLSLWSLASSMIWLITAKRYDVLFVCAGATLLFWGPLLFMLIERRLFGSEIVELLVNGSGWGYVVEPFYRAVARGFGYSWLTPPPNKWGQVSFTVARGRN